MSETNTIGTVVEFVPDDGVDLGFTPSRPGKDECVQIGWRFYEGDDTAQAAMLDDLGPVLVRRSLRVFGNYASRTGQRDVAEYAATLRDEIKVLRERAS